MISIGPGINVLLTACSFAHHQQLVNAGQLVQNVLLPRQDFNDFVQRTNRPKQGRAAELFLLQVLLNTF